MDLPVDSGSNDGSGRPSFTKRPMAAVEIDKGNTAALARGRESGMAQTCISGQVL